MDHGDRDPMMTRDQLEARIRELEVTLRKVCDERGLATVRAERAEAERDAVQTALNAMGPVQERIIAERDAAVQERLRMEEAGRTLAAKRDAAQEQVEHLSQYAVCSRDGRDGIAHGGAAVCQACYNHLQAERDAAIALGEKYAGFAGGDPAVTRFRAEYGGWVARLEAKT